MAGAHAPRGRRPYTHTSFGPSTEAAVMLPPNVFTTANFDPVHRSTRDPLKRLLPNAHTFAGDDAAA